MLGYDNETRRLTKIIETGAGASASTKDVIEMELLKWKDESDENTAGQ